MTKCEERIISGALFDFCGYLTTRDEAITAGAQHHPSPLLDELEKWAAKRHLSLEEADVMRWHMSVEDIKE